MNYLGIDLSLTGTGLCLLSGDGQRIPAIETAVHPDYLWDGYYLRLVRTDARESAFERWGAIRKAVLWFAESADVIAIEGYSFGSHMAHARSIAELGGIVRYGLAEMGKTPVEIPPTVVKKFATGKGGAEKNLVLLHTFKRYGVTIEDDNLCDAFILAKISEAMTVYGSVELPVFQDEVIHGLLHPTQKKRKTKKAGL